MSSQLLLQLWPQSFVFAFTGQSSATTRACGMRARFGSCGHDPHHQTTRKLGRSRCVGWVLVARPAQSGLEARLCAVGCLN